jgi:hypothetical protein
VSSLLNGSQIQFESVLASCLFPTTAAPLPPLCVASVACPSYGILKTFALHALRCSLTLQKISRRTAWSLGAGLAAAS